MYFGAALVGFGVGIITYSMSKYCSRLRKQEYQFYGFIYAVAGLIMLKGELF